MVSGRFLSSDGRKSMLFFGKLREGGRVCQGGAPVPYGSLAVLEKKIRQILEKRPWPTPSQIAALGEIRLSDVDRTLPGMCNASILRKEYGKLGRFYLSHKFMQQRRLIILPPD